MSNISKLKKIKELLGSLLPEEQQFEAVTTDKGVIYVETIEEDQVVEVGDENGENRTKAEDGDYLLEDGRTITVVDGKITEVKEKEEEKPEGEPEGEPTEFEKTKMNFEQSYTERIRIIAEAVAGLYRESYIVDAGDTYAIAEIWDESTNTSKYIRFDLTWNEDHTAVTLDNETEVVSAFVPKETPTETPKEETNVETNVEPNVEANAETNVEMTNVEMTNVEEPVKMEETPAEPEEKPEEDLKKTVEDLVKRVEELERKLAKVEEETPATPEQEFEALGRKESAKSQAVRYAEALRK